MQYSEYLGEYLDFLPLEIAIGQEISAYQNGRLRKYSKGSASAILLTTAIQNLPYQFLTGPVTTLNWALLDHQHIIISQVSFSKFSAQSNITHSAYSVKGRDSCSRKLSKVIYCFLASPAPLIIEAMLGESFDSSENKRRPKTR